MKDKKNTVARKNKSVFKKCKYYWYRTNLNPTDCYNQHPKLLS